MSWLDKINTDLTITTGDGAAYKPGWVNASYGKEFNTAMFEYIEVDGTYVSRKKPKGRRYNLEIHFQGNDCLDITSDFDKSSDDPRAWTIQHPFYGKLLVQPLSLVVDNSGYNVSKITVPVVETIPDTNPVAVASPADSINEQAEACNEDLNNSYAEVQPGSKDIATLTDNVKTLYDTSVTTITSTLDAEKYFNAFNTANAFITIITADPLTVIGQVQNLIIAPYRFANSVKSRIDTLKDAWEELRDTVSNVLDYNLKKIYEHNAGSIITAMAQSTVTGITGTDYTDRKSVFTIIEILTGTFSGYVADLDIMQSLNGSGPLSYIPNPAALLSMSGLVNYTVNNLFAVANNAKQERVLILEEDSNVILLAQRFYGLKPDDSTIDYLMSTNNITDPYEILEVKKGRRLLYYV